jgi:hypothetical protein
MNLMQLVASNKWSGVASWPVFLYNIVPVGNSGGCCAVVQQVCTVGGYGGSAGGSVHLCHMNLQVPTG